MTPSPAKLRELRSRWYALAMRPGICEITYNLTSRRVSHNLEAHHLITKRHLATAFHPLNALCLSADRHKWNEELSAHKTPAKFEEWLRVNRPIKHEFLMQNRHKVEKPDWSKIDQTLREWEGK